MNKWRIAVPHFLSALNGVYGGNHGHFSWRTHHISNNRLLWLHSWRSKRCLVWEDFWLSLLLNYRWGKRVTPFLSTMGSPTWPPKMDKDYTFDHSFMGQHLKPQVKHACIYLDSIRPWLPCRTGQTRLDLRLSEEPLRLSEETRKAIWPFSVVCLLAVRQDSGSGTVSKEEGALHRGVEEDEGKIFRFCVLFLRN